MTATTSTIPSRLRRASRPLLAAIALPLIVAALTFAPRPANARTPRLLRAGTNPFVFKFGIGPALRIDDVPTQFRMTQEIGYHLMGGGDGPVLGFSFAEAFGRNAVTFQLGPDFWYDIQPVRGLGLYLAPMFHVGYSLLSFEAGRNDVTYHFFDIRFGFEISLVLGNRGVVFFRPFEMNMFVGDWFGARYDLLFGGGVTF